MTSTAGNAASGVITIAHGDRRYAWQAVNLARSIRLRDRRIPLAVATDLDASAFEGMFDIVVPWDFSVHPGLVAKLDLYETSPFRRTLYLDSDMLMYVTVEEIFRYLEGDSFAVIGQNSSHPDYFPRMEPIRAVVPSATYPRFIGGLYYFERGALAEQIFRSAAALLPHYDELGILRLNGMPNEEPLFSLAMAMESLPARPARTPHLLINPSGAGAPLEAADVLTGQCIQVEDEVRVRRAMLHFYNGATRTFAYVLEAERLAAAWRSADRRVDCDPLVRARALRSWFGVTRRSPGALFRAMRRRLPRSKE